MAKGPSRLLFGCLSRMQNEQLQYSTLAAVPLPLRIYAPHTRMRTHNNIALEKSYTSLTLRHPAGVPELAQASPTLNAAHIILLRPWGPAISSQRYERGQRMHDSRQLSACVHRSPAPPLAGLD